MFTMSSLSLQSVPPIIIAPGAIIRKARILKQKSRPHPMSLSGTQPTTRSLSNNLMCDFMSQKGRHHNNSENRHHIPCPIKKEPTEIVPVYTNREADADDKRRRDAYVLEFFWASRNTVFAFVGVLAVNVTVIV